MGKRDELFSGFAPVTTHEWEEKIRQDLKGLSFDKLLWDTAEGFEVRPFYRQEDLEGLEYLKAVEGNSPFINTRSAGQKSWEIRQDIVVNNCVEANAVALNALNSGATALGFVIPDTFELDGNGMRDLLNDIYIDCIDLNFITTLQAGRVFKLLAETGTERGFDLQKITGSINADPLGYLTTHGDYPGGTEKAFEDLSALIREATVKMKGMQITGVNGLHFANAGSTLAEELAFSLAVVSEYLDKLSGRALSIDDISRSFRLNFSAGPVYFMEIAKLRAARVLYAHLLKAWNPKAESSLTCYIHSVTAEWNQTIADPSVNMLRGTTASMAAIIGGADSLTVIPFDHPFRKSSAIAERIARNTQIVLKEEASLVKVSDPSSGSYYIENLTDSIAASAWKLFLEVDEVGGYLKALEEGIIQDKIKLSANRRDLNFATRRQILLGTNQYPNVSENFPPDLDPSIAFPEKGKKSGHILEPLQEYRGAQPFEQLRIRTAKLPKKPVVFLLTFGNLNWRKARATFATNFFACAGYEIVDNPGFDDIGQGVEAALAKKASLIILCSSDDEYTEAAPAALNAIHGKALLVVAGYPKESIEELRSKGVENFIHIRSNLIEEIERYHQLLGID